MLIDFCDLRRAVRFALPRAAPTGRLTATCWDSDWSILALRKGRESLLRVVAGSNQPQEKAAARGILSTENVMKQSTAYVVTSGEYSEYHICGVYLDKERAERSAELYNGEIEEWLIDEMPDAPVGMVGWEVEIRRDGTVVRAEVCRVTEVDNRFAIIKNLASEQKPKYGMTTMFARDRDHAIKIANERRTFAIAEGRWDSTSD